MPIAVPIAEPVKGMSMDVSTAKVIDTGGSAILDEMAKFGQAGVKYAMEITKKRKEASDQNYVDDQVIKYSVERAKMVNDLEREKTGTDGADYYKKLKKWDEDFQATVAADEDGSQEAKYALQGRLKAERLSTLVNGEIRQTKIFNEYIAKKPENVAYDLMKNIPEMSEQTYFDYSTTGFNQFNSTVNTAEEKGMLSPEKAEELKRITGDNIVNTVGERIITSQHWDNAVKLVGTPRLWDGVMKATQAEALANGDMESYNSMERLKKKHGPLLFGEALHKASPMSNALSGPNKEKLVRAMFQGWKQKENQDSDETKRATANLVAAWKNDTADRGLLQQAEGPIIKKIRENKKMGTIEKLDLETDVRYANLFNAAKAIMVNMPDEEATNMINDFQKINIATGESSPAMKEIIRKHNLGGELWPLLRQHPEVGTLKHAATTNDLRTWNQGYRTALKANAANAMITHIKPLQQAWAATMDMDSSPEAFAANKEKLAKAIGLTKLYGQAAGVSSVGMSYIPDRYMDKTLSNLNEMAQAGNYDGMNQMIEDLKDSITSGTGNYSASAKTWADLAGKKGDDAFTKDLAAIATFPMEHRQELIRWQIPKNQEMLATNLKPTSKTIPDFVKIVAEHPNFLGVKNTILEGGDDNNKQLALGLQEILGTQLAAKYADYAKSKGMSTLNKNIEDNPEKFKESIAPQIKEVMDKYINKQYTTIETGSAALAMPTEVMDTFVRGRSENFKHNYAHNPAYKKGMLQVSEVLARQMALNDPNFFPPPDFIAAAVKMHQEFNVTKSINELSGPAQGMAKIAGKMDPRKYPVGQALTGYDGRFGTMEGIKKAYLENARVTNDATGGVKFMVNGSAVPTYSKIPNGMRRDAKPYSIPWDALMRHPDFEHGVNQVSDPEKFFDYIKNWGSRKGTYLKPIKQAQETIRLREKTTLKETQTELTEAEKAREAGFEEEGLIGKLIPD